MGLDIQGVLSWDWGPINSITVCGHTYNLMRGALLARHGSSGWSLSWSSSLHELMSCMRDRTVAMCQCPVHGVPRFSFIRGDYTDSPSKAPCFSSWQCPANFISHLDVLPLKFLKRECRRSAVYRCENLTTKVQYLTPLECLQGLHAIGRSPTKACI
jgi:hypothetical protein